jgi:hypothetical protein
VVRHPGQHCLTGSQLNTPARQTLVPCEQEEGVLMPKLYVASQV